MYWIQQQCFLCMDRLVNDGANVTDLVRRYTPRHKGNGGMMAMADSRFATQSASLTQSASFLKICDLETGTCRTNRGELGRGWGTGWGTEWANRTHGGWDKHCIQCAVLLCVHLESCVCRHGWSPMTSTSSPSAATPSVRRPTGAANRKRQAMVSLYNISKEKHAVQS